MRKNSVKRTSFSSSMVGLPKPTKPGKQYSHTNIRCDLRKSSFCNSLPSIASVEMSQAEINGRMASPDFVKDGTPGKKQDYVLHWFENTLKLIEIPIPPTGQRLAQCFDQFQPICVHLGWKVNISLRGSFDLAYTQRINEALQSKNQNLRFSYEPLNCMHSPRCLETPVPLALPIEQPDTRDIQTYRNRRQLIESSSAAFTRRAVVCVEEVKKVNMKESDWTFGFTGQRIEVSRKKGRKICSVETTVNCERQNIENIYQGLPHLNTPARRRSNRGSDLDSVLIDPNSPPSFITAFQVSLEGALKHSKTSRRVEPLTLEDDEVVGGMRKQASRKYRF